LRNFDRQNCWQNTYSKDFARQNAESMGFTRRFLIASVLAYVAAYAPFAGTMMDRIRGCAQAWMSQGGCGFFWSVASKIGGRLACRRFFPWANRHRGPVLLDEVRKAELPICKIS
jgi:hypothetical protein